MLYVMYVISFTILWPIHVLLRLHASYEMQNNHSLAKYYKFHLKKDEIPILAIFFFLFLTVFTLKGVFELLEESFFTVYCFTPSFVKIHYVQTGKFSSPFHFTELYWVWPLSLMWDLKAKLITKQVKESQLTQSFPLNSN